MCRPGSSDALKSRQLVYVVTSPMTADYLMRGHLRYMRERGWQVTIISSPGKSLDRVAAREGVDTVGVPMQRQPAPFQDLLAVIRLIVCIWRLRPDIINYGTPKAGLLAAVAARFCCVPVRIYTLRGLRCEGASGLAYHVYRTIEKIVSVCSTSVICVSPSLRKKAIEMGAIPSDRSLVLGKGSSNGVDLSRFASSSSLDQRVRKLRRRLSIQDNEVTIVFVGRMVRDKGVPELVQAFERVQGEFPLARLVFAGPNESSNGVSLQTWDAINGNVNINWLGETTDTPAVFALADIVALPTHREGFPNVALEAAAAGRPLVVSNATGAIDSVDPGVTGLLFETGSVDEIVHALLRYLRSSELRAKHGNAGRMRVQQMFSSEEVWNNLNTMYHQCMGFGAHSEPRVQADVKCNVGNRRDG